MTTAWVLAIALTANLPPPLVAAMKAARAHNHAVLISRAQLAEQDAAVRQALAAFTPTLQAQGSYTRNEYQAEVTFPPGLKGIPSGTIVITPSNQLTASVGLSVPLFDASSLERYREAKEVRAGATDALRATDAEVLLSTAQAYYQVVASQGVVEAAKRAVATAEETLRVNQVKLRAGSTTQLTVDRSEVDLARAQETLATSRKTRQLARRNLETLTGAPVPATLPAPEPARLPTEPEKTFVEGAERNRPEIAQLTEAVAQAQLAVREAVYRYYPTLSGAAREYFTNATGFIGESAYWAGGVTLSWNFDPVGMPAAIRRARAAVEEAQQRLDEERDTVRDQVHAAWLEIAADHVQVEEATSEVRSAREAVTLAGREYDAGTATELDLSQAQRDAFNADATLAQAQANLAYALVSLANAAGVPLLEQRR